ncbi:hypothetical protein ACHAWF_004477 [Thalassiosira exigua]
MESPSRSPRSVLDAAEPSLLLKPPPAPTSGRERTPSTSTRKRMACASAFHVVVALSTACALRLVLSSGARPASLFSSTFAPPPCGAGQSAAVVAASDDSNDDGGAREGAPKRGLGFDFAVIGFPKTGTTFLLDVLGRHPEVVMPDREFCEVHGPDGERAAAEWLRNRSSTTMAATASTKKYGIKCPTMIRNANAIENLAKMATHTRLLLSLRHPVRYFESFYNYRVLEHYEYGRNETIPTPFELSNGTKQWRDVSTAYVKYDVFMRQLAKVPINMTEMRGMLDDRLYQKQISPNPFKVFVFAMDQLNDKNDSRRTKFQTDLQEFLGLETPLTDLTQVPKANSAGGRARHPKQMDVCDRRYDGIRKQLLASGRRTSSWIRDKFVQSPDVVVSDEEYFSAILETWGKDPCQ